MPKKTKSSIEPVKPPVAKRAGNRRVKSAEPEVIGVISEEPAKPADTKLTISRDDIATLAFSYWEKRGYQGGSEEEDWNRAEQELRSLLG